MLDLIKILILVLFFDSLYLYIIKNKFNQQIRAIQGTDIQLNIPAAVLCYFVIAFGLYWFIIKQNSSIFDAMLLGWVIYFIYELTSKSLFTNWEVSTVLIDGLWGGILFGLVTWVKSRV